ncbi:Nucleolar protein 56 [Tolypocladium ophioglossoides CBS 100239]|uniref:Nucleolar protein 56 n=1 Tax=Tolypocladium ophioglossoides (strain CBS 100239) TaxID=1163406 RepID=A0A0L0MYD9_TOLOC|nr:Nucleolar protein 56 [Tolypocladium ophioglossoides CBS 100239]
MSHIDYALFEAPVGYAVFKMVHQADAVGLKLKEVQEAATDLSKFGKMVKLVNFTPFDGHADAINNINEVSEGICTDFLKSVLELNLPKTSGKKSKVVLGVSEKGLAGAIKAEFPGLECETADTSEIVADVIRGIRLHAEKLIEGLSLGDIEKACLGMAHAYSRAKVKFSATRNDNHIIQASAIIDSQDKSLNQFLMRVREWYGWHFPELVKIVSDNLTYAKLVLTIGNKKTLTDDRVDDIAAVVGEDGNKAQAIIDAAKVSMGTDISDEDLQIMLGLTRNVVKQAENRQMTSNYLQDKMHSVAPNLQALIGTTVGARLISQAGSLNSLAKSPASTLQIMGAEKALFRALKSKSNTPKYGIIYHSSFIGRAAPRDKGRISRYVANKCSMACRIDNFSMEPSTRFGEAFKEQVNDRLEFYATGKKPSKNADVMKAAIASLGDVADGGSDAEMADAPAPASAKKDKKKKEKKEKSKDKKRKRDEEETATVQVDDAEKKKKKKRKSKAADDE